MNKTKVLIGIIIAALALTGCSKASDKSNAKLKAWCDAAELSDNLSRAELYQAALSEGTLVVYSVSGRAFEAKEAFEAEYPGLSVEIKDIRSNDVVDMLKENYSSETFGCDVVICSDCDGSLYKELIEPGIIYTYVPWDIEPKMKEGHTDPELDFLIEAIMVFYNTEVFDEDPVANIWELTEERFDGRIMMSSPLSSFSTYGFCAQLLNENEALSAAYEEYAGKPLEIPDGKTAGMVFWESLSPNLCYVNSNDEVLEGVGNSTDTWLGIMISSKVRYQDLGYHFAPALNISPFSGVYTPNCIAMAGGAENVNSAKLFIRYIMGETDGTAKGAAAFSTEGSWSPRTDMPDGSSISMEAVDAIEIDKSYLYDNREMITGFFGRLLEENVGLK